MIVTETINKINTFLKSKRREFQANFKHGYYLRFVKHIKEGELFLEIHSPGYDDTLPIEDAVSWIQWEILDCSSNGLI